MVDAKGVRSEADAFVIIECRRYTTSRQKQEHVAALAYRILDTGAAGGIVVSPLGLQKGAAMIAAAEGITPVYLCADATRADYILGFLNQLLTVASGKVNVNENVVHVIRSVGPDADHEGSGDG
jgi:hypothetical protein